MISFPLILIVLTIYNEGIEIDHFISGLSVRTIFLLQDDYPCIRIKGYAHQILSYRHVVKQSPLPTLKQNTAIHIHFREKKSHPVDLDPF